MIGRRKEKLDKDALVKLIRNLERTKLGIEARRSMYESQIKSYLKKGKTPPPGLLVSWRTANMLSTTLDSVLASLNSSLMLMEVRDSIQQALGEGKKIAGVAEAFEELMKALKDINVTLHQMTRVHQRMLEQAQMASQTMENVLAEMAGTSEEILPEVAADALAEFLEVQKRVDPEFVKSLPEDIKKKILEGG